MRVAAKFQFASVAGLPDAMDRVTQVIQGWADKKFGTDETGRSVILASGLPATFDRLDETFGNARLTEFSIIEPVGDGKLRTHVKVLSTSEGIRFQCALAIESDGGLHAPRVDLRAPRFIRSVVDLKTDWRIRVDGERIFAKCFEVDSGDLEELESLITSSHRRLPVILVSELDGETIAGDLHERISNDLCGLAHTCRLSREASWKLTERIGKKWSCYNGAVRLFWPFRMNRTDPRAHPLWTYDFLLQRSPTERAARDYLRLELIEQLFEASTFVADDPAFSHFTVEKIRHLHDAARVNASQDGDFRALADLYAKENDELRAALDAKAQEAEILQQNIEALTIALRSGQTTVDHGDPDEAPPQTVADALQIARSTLADWVAFSESVDTHVATLSPAAGPPDKILRYLRTLGDLSRALDGGVSLGRSVPIWLRENGVECSIESETVKGNKEARRRRTFHIGKEDTYCEYHAKPSDGVSPDMCVRIYFAVSADAPRIRVGYIGRHFD